MKDPYGVLGVSRQAGMDEIKKVYHDLVRKYHPDNYVGNELADLAQEKMKEINEAYDAIVKERERGGSASANNTWNAQSGGGYGVYVQIREFIQSGRLDEAGSLLEQQKERPAEWCFCMGSLCYRRGWFDEAARQLQRAAEMEPNNMEYRQAAEQVRVGPRGRYYQPRTGGTGGVGFGLCDCCTTMLCAQCLCDGCC